MSDIERRAEQRLRPASPAEVSRLERLAAASQPSALLGPDLAEAERFLFAINPAATSWCFRTFGDAGRGAGRNFNGSFADCATDLQLENGKGRGVFVVINEGGGKDSDIARIRAVFADFDKTPLPAVFDLEPHIIVESSRGKHHAYWLVDGLPVAEFKALQQRIAARYGSDPSVCNASRVMRLPGFIHRKPRDDEGHSGEPFRSRIGHESGAPPYSADDIRAAFPPTARPALNGSTAPASGECVVTEDRHTDLLKLAAKLARQVHFEGLGRDAALSLLYAEAQRWRWTRDMPSDEICRALEGAIAKCRNGEWRQADSQRAAPHANDGLILKRGDEFAPRPIHWLWEDHLALGKMHLAAGVPSTGKTTIALSLMAATTRGGPWPDGSHSKPGDAVMWSGEDDAEDTLIPRLIAMGADMVRIHIICGMREDGERRAFDPAHDCEHLLASLPSTTRLLVIDPISSAVTGDSHKNAEVRRSLQPLVDAAQAMKFALLGVTHFAKGTAGRDPLERMLGSVAFGALTRVAFIAAKQPADGSRPERRLFVRAKSNIGPDGGGFVYGVEFGPLSSHPDIVTSRVVWGEAIDGSARDVLAEVEADPMDESQDAAGFLREILLRGPRPAKEIYREAGEAGFGVDQMKRAKKKIGAVAEKIGFGDGWKWNLRPHEGSGRVPTKYSAPFTPFDSFSAPFEGSEGSEGSGKGGGTLRRTLAPDADAYRATRDGES